MPRNAVTYGHTSKRPERRDASWVSHPEQKVMLLDVKEVLRLRELLLFSALALDARAEYTRMAVPPPRRPGESPSS